jgi:hypothetical protein
MQTMLAVPAHRGSADPHLDTVPIPEPGPDDVLVKVAAAGFPRDAARPGGGPPSLSANHFGSRSGRDCRSSRVERAPIRRGRSGTATREPQLPQLCLLSDRPRHEVSRASDHGAPSVWGRRATAVRPIPRRSACRGCPRALPGGSTLQPCRRARLKRGNGGVDRSADTQCVPRGSFVSVTRWPRGRKLLASRSQEAPTRDTACRKVAPPE